PPISPLALHAALPISARDLHAYQPGMAAATAGDLCVRPIGGPCKLPLGHTGSVASQLSRRGGSVPQEPGPTSGHDPLQARVEALDRKSTRLNSSHVKI